MNLYRTKPDTEGKRAVLLRSRLLTEFKWTPKRDIASYKKGEPCILPAGEEISGFPYSSTEISDKFITENISFETFLSMIPNPDSALYNKNYGGGYNGKIWTYCGIVCNGLVRFSYNIQRRVSTKRWMDIPGMRMIARHGEYTAEDIRLCDTLYAFGEGRNHVTLVTDILRDEDGAVREIEVSEAIRTSCVRRSFTTEKFFEHFKLFHLTRYDYVDSVQMPPCEWENILFKSEMDRRAPKIAVDYGNRSNYRLGDETVISAFSDGDDSVILCRYGKEIERILTNGYTKIIRKLDKGYYTATLFKSGESVEFAVTDISSSYTVSEYEITVNFEDPDSESKLLYMDFRERTSSGKICSSLSEIEEVTEEERLSKSITRRIPDDAFSYKLYFKNKYGVFTHQMIIFR